MGIPQPPLVGLAPHKRPLLVEFGLESRFQSDFGAVFVAWQPVDSGVDLHKAARFFLKWSSPSACRSPTRVRYHGCRYRVGHRHQLVFYAGFIRTVTVGQHKGFCGAIGVLATIALFATCIAPRFHDAVVFTLWAGDFYVASHKIRAVLSKPKIYQKLLV